MARRLTKEEKNEILNAFCDGKTPSELSLEYSCSSNTVIRVVKGMLPPEQYLSLKENRSKERIPNIVGSTDKELNSINLEKDQAQFEENVSIQSEILNTSQDDLVLTKESNEFQELEPLDIEFKENKVETKIEFDSLSNVNLPEVVYMLVDKKIELESKPLREFSEFSFLPESEQDNLAVSLYVNQRSAKRDCSRGQRVIKVPDTNVFILSAPYLLSKGITRLVLDEELIAIDN